MTEQGKDRAKSILNSLSPTGCTNLYAGIKTAIELVNRDPLMDGRYEQIMLLTDGCPTDEPRGGTVSSE
jgi:Mg-chelatase subunit ChlD